MLDQKLSDELHLVGDQLEVPPDLFPARRIALAARPWWRRPVTLGVSVAAACALVFGLTPAGQRTVQAAAHKAAATVGNVLNVHITSGDGQLYVIAVPAPANVPSDAKVGMTEREHPGGGYTLVAVAKQVLTVAELKQQRPDLPLPVYLPPDSSVRAKLDTYIDGVRLYLSYSVPDQGIINLLIRGGALSETGVGEVAGPHVREVTVGGRPAKAFPGGGGWNIVWAAPAGVIELYGTLPLEELLMVAESIPEMTP